MLPKGRLGRSLFNHLKVFKGPKHPHQAQQAQDITNIINAKPAQLKVASWSIVCRTDFLWNLVSCWHRKGSSLFTNVCLLDCLSHLHILLLLLVKSCQHSVPPSLESETAALSCTDSLCWEPHTTLSSFWDTGDSLCDHIPVTVHAYGPHGPIHLFWHELPPRGLIPTHRQPWHKVTLLIPSFVPTDTQSPSKIGQSRNPGICWKLAANLYKGYADRRYLLSLATMPWQSPVNQAPQWKSSWNVALSSCGWHKWRRWPTGGCKRRLSWPSKKCLTVWESSPFYGRKWKTLRCMVYSRNTCIAILGICHALTTVSSL